MDFYSAIHDIARDKNMSLEKVSLATGHTSGYINSARSRGSVPSITNAAMLAEVVGYKVCLVNADEIPDDAYVIE